MPAPHLLIDVDPERVVSVLRPHQLEALRRQLTPTQVCIDPEKLRDFARDESPVRPVLPAAAVFPTSTQEVSAVLAFCHRERIPVTPRGAGSGKVGGAVPLYGGIVLALERLRSRLEFDVPNRMVQASPNIVTGELRARAEDLGLFYPVDPNSLAYCSLGGNVAANAAGPSSLKYGATREQVLALEVVLADGTILQPGRPTTKCSTGYDLCGLFVGSEGTLGVITGMTLRLQALPAAHRTLFATFASTRAATETLTALTGAGLSPCAAEFFDAAALEPMLEVLELPGAAQAGLLLELDGAEAALEQDLERLGEIVVVRAQATVLARDQNHRRTLWEARQATSVRVKKRYSCYLSQDVTVPPGRLPELVDVIQRLKAVTGIDILCYGHAGDGNLHVNFLYQSDELQSAVDRAVESLFRSVVALGGTLSGEHGIGATKRRYLSLEQSHPLIEWQQRLKRTLDPHDILNPGKIFPVS